MTKETVYIREKKVSLSVTNSKISAILRKDTAKTGIRLYDNGCLGVAGAIGSYNEEELTDNAKRMLDFKLPYDAEPTVGSVASVDLSGKLDVTDEAFVKTAEKILDTMNKQFPQFMFSHKIELTESESKLTNDLGTNLYYKDKSFDCVLLIKHRDSKNLMDGQGIYVNRNMDFDQIIDVISKECRAYEKKVDFGEAGETIPVIIHGRHFEFLSKFAQDLRGDVFANGASLLSGKKGEKLFSDKFTLNINRNSEKTFNPFFDGEGVTLNDNKFALIDKGILVSPYTSKRMAKQYNLPITGSASMSYDSTPDASPYSCYAESNNQTIKELLGGKVGILVIVASGGDYTPQGEFAAPIQTAYMFDGENYLGRLPQLSMSSNIFDMFGKDYVGVSSDGDYPGSVYNYMVVDMNVKKIDGWM